MTHADKIVRSHSPRIDGRGHEGEPCPECGNPTLIRNGVSLKCDTCDFKSPDRCPFCEISNIADSLGGQNITFAWKLDIHPVSPGHMVVVPKRHVVSLPELTREEWTALHDSIKEAMTFIEKLGSGIKEVYESMLCEPITRNSVWFLQRALAHSRLGQKSDGYNHGLNDGRSAGRTIDHLHWHIIPRYRGDMDDPRGGVRYVIPELGNYSVSRS